MIKVIKKPTPNFRGVRRDRARGVCIHVMEGTEIGTDQHFASDPTDVSAHFGVGLDGELRQWVSLESEAWAQGRIQDPTWKFLRANQNPNSYLISIEHEGYGRTAWPEEQLLTSTILSAWLAEKYSWLIDGSTFVEHRKIFAGKSCPGPAFNLDNYLVRVRSIRRVLGRSVINLIEGVF